MGSMGRMDRSGIDYSEYHCIHGESLMTGRDVWLKVVFGSLGCGEK